MDTAFPGSILTPSCKSQQAIWCQGRGSNPHGAKPQGILRRTNSLPFPVSEGYGERPYSTRVMDTQMDTCFVRLLRSDVSVRSQAIMTPGGGIGFSRG